MAYAARPRGMPAAVQSPPMPPHGHPHHHQVQGAGQGASPGGGGPPGYQGTLAPGTKVQVGAVVVTVKRYLSQGGFAHVYLVTSSQPIPMPGSTSGETLHVLKRMAVPDKEALAVVRSEVEVHKSLRNHPNIVHFIEASASALPTGGYEVFILMEYCAGGGIIDLMNSRLRNRLTEKEVLKIFGDVCLGLAVMHHHDPPLMHRDLKIENILLSPPPRDRPAQAPTYKLCDFGSTKPILSRRAPRSMEEIKRLEEDLNRSTTLQYRAPEMVDVYQRRVIDEKADIWAMGVFLYKLCYYTTPFEENGGGPLAILNARYRFPPNPPYSTKLKELIASMLQEHSTSRPTIDDVILGVHRILGTSPPASALHYTQLASSGKQVNPLPSVVRTSAKESSSSTSSSSSGATYASGPDAAARALAIAQGRANVTPSAKVVETWGDAADLIDMAPSEEDRRRAEEAEVKKRAEGITPMRRGRPTKTGAASSNVPPASSARPLIAQLTGEKAASKAAAMASSNRPVPSPAPKPASASPTGFADSFELGPAGGSSDAKSALSPGAAAAAATIASSASSRNFFASQSASLDVPSRSTGSVSPAAAADFGSRSTPLRHSPALPGFSASNSPAPREDSSVKSPPPTAPSNGKGTANLVDVDASRFPSVEELDARYAIPATPSANSSTSSSAAAAAASISSSTAAAARRALAAAVAAPSSAPQRSSTISIPGMSSRASLSSIAGRFGGTTTGGAAGRLNLTGTAGGALPSAASTGGSSSQSLDRPGERPRKGSVTSRWPHHGTGANGSSNGSSSTAAAGSDRPRPPSAASKPANFHLPSSASTLGASAGGVLSPNASGRPMPPLPARKPVPKDWLTGDHDEEGDSSEAKTQLGAGANGATSPALSSVASGAATASPTYPAASVPPSSAYGPLKWEGRPLSAEPSKEAYRSPARYGVPSAKPKADEEDAAEAGKERDVAEDDDDASGDSSEDEGPEDLDAPSKVGAGASGASSSRPRPASALPAPARTPGKVKPPAWLAAEKQRSGSVSNSIDGGYGRSTGKMAAPSWPPSRSTTNEAETASSAGKPSSSPPASTPVEAVAKRGEEESLVPPVSASAVRAPAWDDDDDEMRNLPLPDVDRPYESRSGGGGGAPSKPDAPLARAKVDEGVSAPPRQNSSGGVELGLSKLRVGDDEARASSEEAASSKRFSDAATSPVAVPSAAEEGIPSPSPTGTSQPILGGASWLDKHNAKVLGAVAVSPAQSPAPTQAAATLPGAPLGVKERQRALLSQASPSSPPPPHTSSSGSSSAVPPPIHKPKPIALRSSASGAKKPAAAAAAAAAVGVNKANLKPWEREAAEKEEVERYGALGKSRLLEGGDGEGEEEEEEEGEGDDVKSSSAGGTEEKERFSGVSSLISQWQMNAQRGAPGWGRIGEAKSNGGFSTTGAAQAREEVLAGRLPGRDV